IVLIADASQNGMSAQYKSITEGITLVCTLVFWNYFLDWLAFRLPWFHRLVQPPPLPLVENGQVQRKNMRQELITLEDLLSNLRSEGVEKVEDVAGLHGAQRDDLCSQKKGRSD